MEGPLSVTEQRLMQEPTHGPFFVKAFKTPSKEALWVSVDSKTK